MEYNFTILSSSPLFDFKPYSEGDPRSGWGTRYSKSGFNDNEPGELGQGTPSRVTRGPGSTVALNFHGTAVHLMGRANATYSVTIDGESQAGFQPSSNVLFSAVGLAQGDHVVQLTAKPKSPFEEVELDEAIFTTVSPSFHNVVIGPNHSSLDYSGSRWFNKTSEGIPTFVETDETEDSVTLTIADSTGLAITGPATFGSGGYTISIDDIELPPFNASSLWLIPNVTLFLVTSLDPSTGHVLKYSNANQGQGVITLSSITLFKAGDSTEKSSSDSSDPSNSSDLTQTAKNTLLNSRIGIVAAGVALVVLISLGVLWYRRRRTRKQKKRPTPNDEEKQKVQDDDSATAIESDSETGEKGSMETIKEAFEVIKMVSSKIDSVQKGLQGGNSSS